MRLFELDETEIPKSDYLEAPEYRDIKGDSIFMAGGISGTKDWQSILKEKLETKVPNLTLINPRRNSFDLSKKSETEKQIKWEHHYLKEAPIILFWFPKETLCPITLLELGRIMTTDKKLFVGCDLDYERIEDVRIQLSLERPDVKMIKSLDALAKQIIEEFK